MFNIWSNWKLWEPIKQGRTNKITVFSTMNEIEVASLSRLDRICGYFSDLFLKIINVVVQSNPRPTESIEMNWEPLLAGRQLILYQARLRDQPRATRRGSLYSHQHIPEQITTPWLTVGH